MQLATAATVEQVLARHVGGTRFEDLPPEALWATKEHVMHTLGTVVAGSAAPGCPALVSLFEQMAGRPESTLLGWGVRVPAHHAAHGNSAMGHAQEFDNNDDRIAYKTSVCAVPAALAVAERRGGVSGREFLTAACLGIDFGIRMGLAIRPQPAHPVAPNLGPFAAVVASAKLLELNEAAIWDAFGLALCGVATVGASTTALSYTKRFQTGAAARNGVFAAVLAANGFSAHQAVFTGPGGYFVGIHGQEGDFEVLTDGLGERFEVVNVGPKAYPTCRYTQGAIDAALALANRHNLEPDDIAEVRVRVGPRDYAVVFGGQDGLAAKQRPQSVVDAQFSIPFTVATALVRRRVALDDMSETAIQDAKVVALAERVVPIVEPGFDVWPADVKPCEVEILTRAGSQRYLERVEYPRGNPRNRVPHAEIQANFLEFGARSARPLRPDAVERARDMIEDLEHVADVAEIAALLSPEG
jgi:2-methylcitrate dehydratase PrpD